MTCSISVKSSRQWEVKSLHTSLSLNWVYITEGLDSEQQVKNLHVINFVGMNLDKFMKIRQAKR